MVSKSVTSSVALTLVSMPEVIAITEPQSFEVISTRLSFSSSPSPFGSFLLMMVFFCSEPFSLNCHSKDYG